MKGRTTNTQKPNAQPKAVPKPMKKGGMAKKGC